jgi:HSP20 family protein
LQIHIVNFEQENIMTTVTRYDPFEDLFRGFLVRPVGVAHTADTPAIKVDVKEDSRAYQVHAELPGVNKEDIQVDVDGAVVAITAERKQDKEVNEDGRVLRTERYFGKVSRSFQLAQEIDEDNVVAKYNAGVLELTLPKKAAVQAKRVTIQ